MSAAVSGATGGASGCVIGAGRGAAAGGGSLGGECAAGSGETSPNRDVGTPGCAAAGASPAGAGGWGWNTGGRGGLSVAIVGLAGPVAGGEPQPPARPSASSAAPRPRGARRWPARDAGRVAESVD